MRKYSSAFIPIFLILSCSSGEIGNSKDVNPETIYIKYNVAYDEGSEKVETLAQFRFAGEEGTTLVLNNPSKFIFDHKEIVVDSNRYYPGAYYKADFAPAEFSGKHEWEYTDATAKVYKQSFDFRPFYLAEEIPNEISANSNLEIKIKGLAEGDNITCEITDTSINTADDKSDYVLKNNAIIIPSSALQKLASGPVDFHISITYNEPLQEPTKEGGVFEYYYGLRVRTSNLLNKKPAK